MSAKRILLTFFSIAVCFSLSGEDIPSREASENVLDTSSNYILKSSDFIRIEVFQEPDLLKEVRISADGMVALPLIGKIKVGGHTIQEAQELIRDLYNRDYLVNPQINLLILEYSERFVQVLGQVNRPGFVVIRPERELTLVEAIAGANGFTRLGKKNAVRLKRKDKNGNIIVMKIDVEEILRTSGVEDIELQEGDIIFVDEKVF